MPRKEEGIKKSFYFHKIRKHTFLDEENTNNAYSIK